MAPTERHLLVISHGFPPYYGGGEHAAYYLARAAAVSGAWRVSVLTSDIGGRLKPRENMDGMTVCRVPARKKEWSNHTVTELLSFLRSASRADPAGLGIDPPDFILAHFTLPGGWVARRIAARSGIEYAVVLHGSDVPGHQPGRFGWIYPLVTPSVRTTWRRAAAVVAVSSPLAERAGNVAPDVDISLIPNGVDDQAFRPPDDDSRPHETEWRMVMVARMDELKGHRFLFEALDGWDDAPRWTLDLYGTGPEADKIKDRADRMKHNDRVHFHGLAERERIADALGRADVLVLPSLIEGMPLVLLEAMASGTPVVATAVGDVPGFVKHGENGLLVEPGDVPALRDQLRRLCGEPGLWAKLQRGGLETARLYSWTSIWKRYEALIGDAGIGRKGQAEGVA